LDEFAKGEFMMTYFAELDLHFNDAAFAEMRIAFMMEAVL